MEITEHIQIADELSGDRATWETLWQDIIDFILPNRQPVLYDEYPGEDRSIEKYDSTANHALFDLAASINSLLTNQSSDWLTLELEDDELNEIEEVKDWIGKTVKVIRQSLDNSNFYSEVHEFYMDLGSFGTGTLYIEPSTDPEKDLNFSARHIREIFVAENAEGMIDTVYRKFKYTVRQCYQKWGDDNSDAVRKMYADKKYNEEVHLLHCVVPREEYDKKLKDTKNMRYASIWIDTDSNHKIKESGFMTFPYAVTRWLKSSGEVYGRSPAIASLADIKTLNSMMYTMLLAAEKLADPPYTFSDEGVDITLDPGVGVPIDPESNGSIQPIIIGNNLPINFDMVKMYRESIKDAFFINSLHLVDNKNMTAEEVRQRSLENARTIGPTFGRLTSEFANRLIDRVFVILAEAGKLDPAPEVIQGKGIKLRYVSPLAKQMKL